MVLNDERVAYIVVVDDLLYLLEWQEGEKFQVLLDGRIVCPQKELSREAFQLD